MLKMADLTLAGLSLSAAPSPAASLESAAAQARITPLPPPTATAIDKDGDLYLVVGSEKRAFQVDSRALIRVSKVWKTMV